MDERQKSDNARARGQACMDKWGVFITEADFLELQHFLGQRFLSANERLRVDEIIDWVEKRARTFRTKSKGVSGGVDWPDDRVAYYIRTLTGLDGDHAKVLNGVGWDAFDSPAGHWCAAMLKIDREAAIRVGRTMVGHYQGQIEGWRK